MSLKNRNFLKLLDYTPAEIEALLDLAADLKAKKKAGIRHDALRGKNIALIFEKTSTRTRCSFEVAAHDLGMEVTYLDPSGSQIGKKESIADTARVLGRMFDGIEYRGYGQQIVEDLAHYAGVPVWNGLTNEYHPTQALADILTMREEFGDTRGMKLTYMGKEQGNVSDSLMVICAKLGINFCSCGPKGDVEGATHFDPELLERCQEIAAQNGCTIQLTEDIDEGVKDADVIYTDVWVGMGQAEELWKSRIDLLSPYRVTPEVMAKANPGAIFMHCLPSFHDTQTTIGAEIAEKFGVTEMEVSDEVFESAQSRVFQEAENRMHTIKAMMYATLR